MSLRVPESNTELRRHELFSDIAEQAASFLIKNPVSTEEGAMDFGNALATWISEHWKGQHIYFNADTPFMLNKRDMDIFNRFERGNAMELGREYNISFVRVYQIHKRVLMELRKRRQPSLFDDAPHNEEQKPTLENS